MAKASPEKDAWNKKIADYEWLEIEVLGKKALRQTPEFIAVQDVDLPISDREGFVSGASSLQTQTTPLDAVRAEWIQNCIH